MTINKDRSQMTEKILDLTMKIMYLLTGEGQPKTKNPSGESATSSRHQRSSEGQRGTQEHIPGPNTGPLSPICDQTKMKVLEVIKEMTKLLTGEVPIRSQDITIYFSLEEWEYLEGHKDHYKDVMMEDEPDGSRKRNPPQRCPHPREDLPIPRHDQVVDGQSLVGSGHVEKMIKEEDSKQHEDLYEENMEESSNYKNSPQRCPCPRDSTPEDLTIPYQDQGEECFFVDLGQEENPPQRCPRPRNSTPEDLSVSHQDQGEERVLVDIDLDQEENPPQRCPRDSSHLTAQYSDQREDQMYVIVKVKEEEEETSWMEYQPTTRQDDVGKMGRIKEEPSPIYIDIDTDGSRKRNPPQRCPHPRDSTPEDLTITHHDQMRSFVFGGEVPKDIKAEVKEEQETLVNGDLLDVEYDTSIYPMIGEESLGETLLSCIECGKCFKTESELLLHFKTHNQMSYSCLECGKGFPDEQNLHTHQCTHTSDQQPLQYPECGNGVTKKVSRQAIHSQKHPYSCSQCDKSYADKGNLCRHQKIHTGERPFSCLECGKSFSRKEHFLTHQRVHIGVRPFSCSECGKGFFDHRKLLAHHRIHTGERPFSCSECDKTYTDKRNLLRHQKIHTGENLFLCPECGKYFTEKAHFIRHERTHTGERPYSCLECGKSFNLKGHYFRHLKIHTGERPYSCLECGKSFIQKEHYFRHQRIHTRELPYSCSECGKGFYEHRNLIMHQRIHTGERPFACTDCDKSYTERRNLLRHQKTHRGASVLGGKP